MTKTLVVQVSCAAIAAGIFAQPAFAQDSKVPTADDRKDSEIILVTAQRREENLQEVPVSVSTFDSDELTSRGVTGISADSLSTIVPSLKGQINLGRGNFFIRGVGNNIATNEASVALYIDGVYLPSTTGNVLELNNIERLEVLKGPQGTLFGRNATAGVIQIVTRTPDLDETVIDAMIGYGNYDTFEGSIYASAPLSDRVAMDISAQFRDQNNGMGRNDFLGTEIMRGSNWGVRSKLLFEPSDSATIWLGVDYAEYDNSFGQQRLRNGQPDLFGNVEPQTGYRDFYVTRDPQFMGEQYGVTLQGDFDIGFATLVSISAYRFQGLHSITDSDGSTSPILNVDTNQANEAYSQELQLVSADDDVLQWQAGVFFYDLTFRYVPPIGYGLSGFAFGPSPTAFLNTVGDAHTTSIAVYGQASYDITPGTTLTGGLRYTWEDADAHNVATTAGGQLPAIMVEDGFKRLTWRLAIEQDVTDDMMVYASYNRGIKTGGFNLFDLTQAYLRPEVLDSYEVGVKSDWFDRMLRINASAYYYDYRDLHVTSFSQQVQTTTNAAAAEVYGLDLDVTLHATDNFTIATSLAFNHARFLDFPNAITNGPTGARIVFDATGNQLAFASPFAASVNAVYEIPTEVGTFSISGSYSYNGDFYWDSSERYKQEAYDLVSGSISWWNVDDTYGIEIWAKNLTNTDYLLGGVAIFTGDLEVPANPRTYGARLRARF